MGFMDGFGRFLQGKPVFQPSTDPHDTPVDSANGEGTSDEAMSGKKIIPAITIDRCESRINDPHMRVTCEIRNTSAEKTIEIDKIMLLGTTRELDTYLRPNESREVVVFEGNMPNHCNYTTTEIPYKDEAGDYFSMQFLVEYNQEANNLYSISRMRPSGVARDI